MRIADELMLEIGAFEAKNKLGHLLDRVEHGEEIVITRHGKEVSRLVPARGAFNRQRAREAALGIREMSRGVTPTAVESDPSATPATSCRAKARHPRLC